MAFIHITLDRLNKGKENNTEDYRLLRSYFHPKSRVIERTINGSSNENAYIFLDRKRVKIFKKVNGAYDHWWVK
jgi:hypothetical protein